MSKQQDQKKNYEGKGPDGKLFKNRMLNRAKFIKNDEYYTLMKDVIQHVEVFKEEWYKDKIIYCPFSSDESNFVKYFKEHGDELGIKELIYTSDDYKNHEDLWMKADLVIDNPPFSIFITEILPWMIGLLRKQINNYQNLTKIQLTAAQLTAAQLTNNCYKTIDFRDIHVHCSGISCNKFLTPDGSIKYVPCTSLCFACSDDMFVPRTIKPLPDWTYQQLLDNNKIRYSTIFKITSHTRRDIISDYPLVELYKDFIGKTLPRFININYFPKDFHGYALCPITSTNCYNKKKEDTGLFSVYGWKQLSIVECYNEEGQREFFRVLIYHE